MMPTKRLPGAPCEWTGGRYEHAARSATALKKNGSSKGRLKQRVDERRNSRSRSENDQAAKQNEKEDDGKHPKFLSVLHEAPKLNKKFTHRTPP
jgi:hypothetical protein